jgi:hypothetical protein
MPEVIGKGMGQLHDDITEVNGGKIIRAVFVRPKLYILEIIGYSKVNPEKLIIAYHIRAKDITKESQKSLTIEKFADILNHSTSIKVEGRRFAKAFKKTG